MKKHIPSILAALALILVVVCLAEIGSLKNQLNNAQNNLSMQIAGVRSSVDNIQFNVKNTINEQANLLESSEWSFGEADIAARTVTLHCAVTPKTYRPEETAVALIGDGREVPMTLNQGAYTATLEIPLFGESVFDKVQMSDGGEVRSETLDWRIMPQFEFLPQVNASFFGGGSGSARDGKFYLKREGQIDVHLYQQGSGFAVASMAMVESIDGVESARTDMPLNTTPSPGVSDGRPSPATRLYPEGESETDFYYVHNKTIEIPFGSAYEMYVEVVDNHGFRHRVMLDVAAVDANGHPTDDMNYWHGEDAGIYDADGRALWSNGKWAY